MFGKKDDEASQKASAAQPRDPSVGVPRFTEPNQAQPAPVPVPFDPLPYDLESTPQQTPEQPTQPEPEPTTEPKPAAEGDLRTPEEHAAQLGSSASEQHKWATKLHGWDAHALATVEPLLISEDTYKAALRAAEPAPPKKGKPSVRMTPHEAAVSPFAPKGMTFGFIHSENMSELQTPEEHARALGHAQDVQEPFRMGGGRPGMKQSFSWKHGAAAQLHGWNAHKLHSAEPFKISRADYEAALDAATDADGDGEYTPHPAALSEYAPKSEYADDPDKNEVAS